MHAWLHKGKRIISNLIQPDSTPSRRGCSPPAMTSGSSRADASPWTQILASDYEEPMIRTKGLTEKLTNTK